MTAETPENALKALQEAGERRLIEAAQHDPSRFAALYEIHFERVYAYVWRRVGESRSGGGHNVRGLSPCTGELAAF